MFSELVKGMSPFAQPVSLEELLTYEEASDIVLDITRAWICYRKSCGEDVPL